MTSITNYAVAYSNKTKRCHLCITEKLHIRNADKANLLNKRSELISTETTRFPQQQLPPIELYFDSPNKASPGNKPGRHRVWLYERACALGQYSYRSQGVSHSPTKYTKRLQGVTKFKKIKKKESKL